MSRTSDLGAALRDVHFVKMTGSGNDFVFFDGRSAPNDILTLPDVIVAICNRHNGIGADGIVVLEPVSEGHSTAADARIRYFNSDGSAADLCGNATLCSTRLAVEFGMASATAMRLLTPAGIIDSRLDAWGPEIDLQAVTDLEASVAGIDLQVGESRAGYVLAGIPHLVVLCEDAVAVDLAARGPMLRRHPALGSAGANVNWVSPQPDGSWRYRTFERGVEGETLACGTGAVATAVLLGSWGLISGPVTIRTSSGRDLVVRFRESSGANQHVGGNEPTGADFRGTANRATASVAAQGSLRPSLRGEGRVVYRGRIATLNL